MSTPTKTGNNFSTKKVEQSLFKKFDCGNMVNLGPFTYKNHTGTSNDIVWQIDIINQRSDTAPMNTVGILNKVELPNGTIIQSPDKSYLKWANLMGYDRLILPDNQATIDLFTVRTKQAGIFFT